MKILTKEEEQAHYNATLTGGIGGGLAGLAVGFVGVYAATRRFPAFNSLTLPLKAFLVTSSGTFAAIVSADKYSRAFEANRSPEHKYKDEAEKEREQNESRKTTLERVKDWGKENRYPIVGASWVASMGIALGLVGRNPYLSTSQKIVQARVYAQGLTLAVLVATAAFEIGDKNNDTGRWETIKVVDPNDPEHKHLIDKKVHHERYAGEDQWRDMIDAEERKMKDREAAIREEEEKDAKHNKGKQSKETKDKKAEHDDIKEEKKTDEKKGKEAKKAREN
ncbi:MAG: hypothetical protein M1827_002192 [Pycnora praestabilis]|nr:MAG: hypothetical protein M1827_002192 [Pycnora praestabilis]